MAELLTNGQFRSDLASWVTSNIDHVDEDGHLSVGCAELDTVAGVASLYQNITTETISGEEDYVVAFAFSFKKWQDEPGNDLVATLGSQTGDIYATVTIEPDTVPYIADEWHRIMRQVRVPITAALRVTFTSAQDAVETDLWRISDVSVEQFPDDDTGLMVRDIAARLMRYRLDRVCVKHYRERYEEVVHEAARQAPRGMWPTDLNTSISTVAEQRAYSLAGIALIEEPWQVRRIRIEDEGEDSKAYVPTRRWRVVDDYGVLYLVFNSDPPDEDREIQIEYRYRPTEVVTNNISLDEEWLVAKCMSLLLLEADPARESQDYIDRRMAYWDGMRQARERVVCPRREPEEYHTTNWRDYE